MGNAVAGARYARTWGLCVGLLVGVTLAFPHGVTALADLFGVSDPVAIVVLKIQTAVYVIPVAHLIIATCIARISTERAKAVGMPAAVGIYIALLAIADIPVGIVVSTLGIAAFTVNFFDSGLFPHSTIATTVALITLSLLRDRRGLLKKHHALAYNLWLALLVLLMLLGLSNLLNLVWLSMVGSYGIGLLELVQTMFRIIERVTLYPVLPVAMFAAASVYLVYGSRGQANEPMTPHHPEQGIRGGFGRRS